MNVTKVCCQGCGADLQIDESIRYVTCNYCHSRLEVVHDATVTHTRQLDKIERTTDLLAGQLKVIELQNDIESLDRSWEKFRNSALIRGKNGHLSEPSTAGSVFGGIIVLIFGIIWIIGTSSLGAPGLSLVGLIFIAFGFFTMIGGSAKAETYKQQQDAYETRRQGLLSRLERERESQ